MNIIIWDYELVWSNSWPKSSACIKESLGVRDSQKLPLDFQKSMPGSLGLPTFKDILSFIIKNLEWIYVLFSLTMAFLLHKWEFKNIEV